MKVRVIACLPCLMPLCLSDCLLCSSPAGNPVRWPQRPAAQATAGRGGCCSACEWRWLLRLTFSRGLGTCRSSLQCAVHVRLAVCACMPCRAVWCYRAHLNWCAFCGWIVCVTRAAAKQQREMQSSALSFEYLCGCALFSLAALAHLPIGREIVGKKIASLMCCPRRAAHLPAQRTAGMDHRSFRSSETPYSRGPEVRATATAAPGARRPNHAPPNGRFAVHWGAAGDGHGAGGVWILLLPCTARLCIRSRRLSPVSGLQGRVPARTHACAVPGSPGRACVVQSSIQREIVRIHELWQKSKSELAARDREIAEWKNKCVACSRSPSPVLIAARGTGTSVCWAVSCRDPAPRSWRSWRH